MAEHKNTTKANQQNVKYAEWKLVVTVRKAVTGLEKRICCPRRFCQQQIYILHFSVSKTYFQKLKTLYSQLSIPRCLLS